MKVGVALRVRYEGMRDVAQAADELGYESVWLPEHLIWPAELGGGSPYPDGRPPVDVTVPTLDALMFAVTLAQATEQVRLGSYVYNLSLRHPFVAARAVQTLDVLSGGRVEFGVGAGWSAGEYAATGVEFASRGRRLDEAIDVLRALWLEDRPAHAGEFFCFGPVVFEPKPVQRPVPILVGGESPAALRRAAIRGDGWIGMAHPPEEAASLVRQVATAADRAGRPPVPVSLGATDATPAAVARYAAAGVDRLIVAPWSRGRDAVDGLRRFAAEALPAAREGG